MPGAVFLEGDKVELRTLEEEDLEFLRDTINHPDVRKGVYYKTPFNLEEEREWFEEGDEELVLAICVDGEITGNIALKDPGKKESREFGIMIHPDFHGNGYGTEAVELLIDHAFRQMNVHKLTARAHETNGASQRIWEKLGFEREAVHREEVFQDGEYRDTYWYGLLREEW